MLIVGINSSGYVSSAAVIRDGDLAFAAAEERYDRRRYSKYFPWKAIRAGLSYVGANLSDVDVFAVGYNPGISVAGRTRSGFSEWPGYPGQRLYSNPNYLLPELGDSDFTETEQVFRRTSGDETRIRYVTHHIAHATNAFLLSGFPEAAILTCDGYGERTTTTWCKANGNGVRTLRQVDFPHSIGSLYATMTQFLGFRPNADEWKVMGAAAYGDPSRYYPAVRSLIRWNEQAEFEIDLSYFNYFDFDVSPMYRPKLEALLGPARRPAEALEQRHYDLAAAIQKLTEEYLGAALVALHNETRCATVCLSGGVFMNSMFNGKATLESPFEQLYVPHAPDDNGNSIGAALWVAWQEHDVSAAGGISKSPFLGASYNDDEIRDTLDRYRLTYRRSDDVASEVAALLADGEIVGWFQGRMEFGDRALGARSILADPRDASMKDKINRAVKYREAYRPFAPSIIDEATQEYFAIARHIDAPS